MSLELIQEYNVYHHIIDFADTNHLYKPFFEISDDDPEGKVLEAVENNYKVILKGSTGSGKSSIINYIMLNLGKKFLPISCNIIGYGKINFDDPADFAKFILESVINNVKLARELSKDEPKIDEFKKYISREISFTEGKKKKYLTHFKNRFSWIPFFLDSNLEVGVEVEQSTNIALTKNIYAHDPIGSINEIVNICNAKEITPIYILDDTDKFLRSGSNDNTKPIDLFFQHTAPLLSELNCPVIFPVHNFYDEFPVYKKYEKAKVDRVIDVPKINSIKNFIALLDKKLMAIDNDFSILNYFSNEAVGMLFASYLNSDDGIRGVMTTINKAVDKAVSLGEVKVNSEIMRIAIIY